MRQLLKFISNLNKKNPFSVNLGCLVSRITPSKYLSVSELIPCKNYLESIGKPTISICSRKGGRHQSGIFNGSLCRLERTLMTLF